mmetsp:Transcript_1795/g.4604  ORF Transcript_1795/g.4604 Transcript_1795/m.4604 type:complete len:255 (-) Transcript_1795:74-838(-)
MPLTPHRTPARPPTALHRSPWRMPTGHRSLQLWRLRCLTTIRVLHLSAWAPSRGRAGPAGLPPSPWVRRSPPAHPLCWQPWRRKAIGTAHMVAPRLAGSRQGYPAPPRWRQGMGGGRRRSTQASACRPPGSLPLRRCTALATTTRPRWAAATELHLLEGIGHSATSGACLLMEARCRHTRATWSSRRPAIGAVAARVPALVPGSGRWADRRPSGKAPPAPWRHFPGRAAAAGGGRSRAPAAGGGGGEGELRKGR